MRLKYWFRGTLGEMGGLLAILKWASVVVLTHGTAFGQDDCRLAILGDSLTAGFGLEIDDAFPAELERALSDADTPCDVINAGVSGDTTAGGASRIEWVLADEPTHLLVELGGNDALRALPPIEMKSNLEKIIEAARKENVPIMLAGMLPPPNLGEAYFTEFGAVFEDLANEHGLYLYPFFLEGVALNPELMQDDQIHPNAAGVDEIVHRITPMVRNFLDNEPLSNP